MQNYIVYIGYLVHLYLITIAAIRGFFPKYVPFYLYLVVNLLFDLTRWMIYSMYGDGEIYLNIYLLSILIAIIMRHILVAFLYSRILDSYPSLKLSVNAFLAFVLVLIPVLTLAGAGQVSFLSIVRKLNLYFLLIHLLAVLNLALGVRLLRLPIGANLDGIIQGLSFYLGTCFLVMFLHGVGGEPFRALRDFVIPFSYMVMLLLFIPYLSKYSPPNKLFVHYWLKTRVDQVMFPYLRRLGIYNRYTASYFI